MSEDLSRAYSRGYQAAIRELGDSAEPEQPEVDTAAMIRELREQARMPKVMRQSTAPPLFADPLDRMTPADIRELLPDLIRAAASRRNTRNEHPLVTPILREKLSLAQLREMTGMTTSDFLSAMTNGLSVLLVSRFEVANRDVQTVTAPVDLTDFKSTTLPHLALAAPTGPIPESVEFPTLGVTITEAPRSGQLRTYAGKVRFSKAVWASYGEQLSADLVDYAANSISLIEMKLLAELLEAGTITTSSSSPLTTAGMNSVANLLRTTTNSASQLSNYGIFALIIPPELEMTARVLRTALGWPDLKLVVCPNLTSATSWFALADPSRAPAILRLRLRGGGIPKLVSNARESGPETGMSVVVIHDVDIALSGAPGLIKATA